MAAAVLAVAIGWLLSAALLGGKVLGPGDALYAAPPFSEVRPVERTANPVLTDAALLYHPHLFDARRQLHDGRLPMWHSLVGAGRPAGAQQAAPLHPLNWPAYVLPFWTSLGWIAALKLLVAGLGAFAFGRSRGLSPPAALLTAVAWGLGLPLIVFLSHWAAIYALLPWALLLVDRICAQPRARDAMALGGLGGVIILGGHPESGFVALTAIAAYAAARTFEGARDRRRIGALLGLATAVAVGVGAITVLPLLEVLSESSRTERHRPPDDLRFLLGFAFPELWGRPDGVELPAPWFSGFASRAVYVGAAPLVLAVAGLAVRRTRDQRLFAVAGLIGLLFTLDLPLLADGLREVPVLSLMHPGNFIWITIFSLTVLAGLGLQTLLDASPAERRRFVRVAAAAALLPIATILAPPGDLGALRDTLAALPSLDAAESTPAIVALTSKLRWVLVAVAGLCILVLCARWRRLELAAGLLICLTVVELVTLSRGYHPAFDDDVADPPAPPALVHARDADPSARLAGVSASLAPNLAERFGARDARVEDLPEIERYSRLWETLGGRIEPLFGLTLWNQTAPRARDLLDVFAVRWVLAEPGERAPGLVTARPGVLENPGARRRAFFTCQWRSASGLDEALGMIRAAPPGALRQTAVIETVRPSGDCPVPQRAARVVDVSDTRVTVTVDAPRAGWVVLADLHYPGWTAEVDGREADIAAADAAVRAVAVAPGRHTVAFDYRPLSYRAGALVSALSVLAILLVLVAARIRRRNR